MTEASTVTEGASTVKTEFSNAAADLLNLQRDNNIEQAKFIAQTNILKGWTDTLKEIGRNMK